MSKAFLTCSFSKWLPMKSLSSHNFIKGACGHQKIAADDNHCGSCLGDYEATKEWLQCPICKVWFHSNCFLIDKGRRWN